MRILMLSQFYPPIVGGEERHVVTLSEALATRGHQVSVATLRLPADLEPAPRTGVKIHKLQGALQRAGALFSDKDRPFAPPFPDPELTLGIRQAIERDKPDIVHAHNWLVHSFLPLKRRDGPGLVTTLHDCSFVCAKKNLMHNGSVCSGPGLFKCFSCARAHYGTVKGAVTYTANRISSGVERRLADRFIAVSRAVARECDLTGNVRHEIIPTFIGDEIGELKPSSDPRLAQLPQSGFLLFVGDVTMSKGAGVLIDAYGMLKSAPPLVLIGRRCYDCPTTVSSNIHFLGSWPHEILMHAWSRCLFGIAPSVAMEGCGTIVMEANAVGRPMIGSDIGGLSDLVQHGRTGLLVEPNNPIALAAAMQRLIDDASLRESMAACGLAHAEQFRARSVVPRIERVYADVLADRAAALGSERNALQPERGSGH
jgi:glycosyltransferase involved in cell wall biosynthesis